MNHNILRFNRPATNWVEAFPLGNGRIGAIDGNFGATAGIIER